MGENCAFGLFRTELICSVHHFLVISDPFFSIHQDIYCERDDIMQARNIQFLLQ